MRLGTSSNSAITHRKITHEAVCDKIYTLEARGNTPYLILKGLEFVCKGCQVSTVVDLSIVPTVETLPVKCAVCDTLLFEIIEDEFEYQLDVVEPSYV